MKKLFLSILTLLVFNYSYSQITVTKSAVESTKPNEPYDRLINFLGVDYHKYIGQELYLVPKRESLRNSGYEGFFINYKKKTTEESNKYNCCSGLNSMHEGLAGAYFIVKDIIEPKSENKNIFFNLYRKDTGETIYYKYNPKYESNFPFLVVSFIQKQKEIFVNKDIMIRNYYKTGNKNPKKIFDINTGEEIIIEKGKFLKCIDLTIESKNYELSYLLKNDKGQEFLFPFFEKNLKSKRVLTEIEVELYKFKFGDEYWNIILQEKVEIGFTEEMTKAALGEPDKINKTNSHNKWVQWVYGNKFYYFEDGKLIFFN